MDDSKKNDVRNTRCLDCRPLVPNIETSSWALLEEIGWMASVPPGTVAAHINNDIDIVQYVAIDGDGDVDLMDGIRMKVLPLSSLCRLNLEVFLLVSGMTFVAGT